MKSRKAIERCAYMMAEMLKFGFTKEQLPELEKLFWQVRNHKTGELKKVRNQTPRL